MEQAISILHGGEPISASEVTHGDGIKLQIVCPYCHEPLLYVAGFSKISPAGRKKQLENLPLDEPEDYTNVDPFFRHYKGISEDAAKCEARSLTPEGREEIKRLATKAKNQRLKLFQRRFWQCIKKSIKLMRYEERHLDGEIDDETTRTAKQMGDILEVFKWHRNWKYNADTVKKAMDIAVDHITPELVDEIKEACHMTEEEYKYFKLFTIGLDNRFQKMVAYEAATFLGTTAGGPILRRLSEIATISLIHYNWEETQPALDEMIRQRKPENFCGLLLRQISVVIATVPWRKMLQSP